MTKLLFVRHGESIYNNAGKFAGQKDVPLTEIGLRQAAVTGKFVAENFHVDAVYSSDLLRAKQTASVIAGELRVAMECDARLREVHLGDWTDEYIHVVQENQPETYARYKQGEAPPNGESFLQLQARVYASSLEIAQRHQNKTVLIVSHGGAIRAFLTKVAAEGEQVPIFSNASVSEVLFDGQTFALGEIGRAAHLEELYTMQDGFLQ